MTIFGVVGAYPGGREWDLLRGYRASDRRPIITSRLCRCRRTIRFTEPKVHYGDIWKTLQARVIRQEMNRCNKRITHSFSRVSQRGIRSRHDVQRNKLLSLQSSGRCTSQDASCFQTRGTSEQRSTWRISVSKRSPLLRQGSLSRAEDAMAAFHATKCSRTSGKLLKQRRCQ